MNHMSDPIALGDDKIMRHRLMEEAIEHIDEALMVFDVHGVAVDCNSACAQFNRFPNKAEWKLALQEGWGPIERVALSEGMPDDSYELVKRAVAGETTRGADYRMRRLDTGEQWLGRYTIGPVRDGDGAIIGAFAVGRDVTAEHALIDRLTVNMRYHTSILESVPFATTLVDDDWIVTAVSRKTEVLFGWDAQDLIGQSGLLLLTELSRVLVMQRYGHLRGTAFEGTIEVGALEFLRKDGSTFTGRTRFSRLYYDGGAIYTIYVEDITEHLAAQATMERLQAQVTHLSRVNAMETMASTLAHELNQPLAAILLNSQTARALLPGETREDVIASLDEVAHLAARAGDIIRKMRSFIRHGEIEKVPARLDAIVQEALALAEPHAREHEVLVGAAPYDGEARVLVDPIQIAQVLVNLISNAVHAVSGRSSAYVDVFIKDHDDHFLRAVVMDNGPAPHVDGRHALAGFGSRPSASDQGLGLSICRTIIESHGGQVWLDHVPSGGCLACFTLPKMKA